MNTKIKRFLDKFSLKTKMLVIISTVVLSMAFVSISNIIEFGNYIYQEKHADLITTANFGLQIAQNFYNQYKEGEISEQEAQTQTLAAINSLRYDNNNYLFVYNYDCILLVNNSRPDLIGQNRCKAESIDHVLYVQEGLKAAQNGGGYYDYLWDAGGKLPVPRRKFSYAVGFEPWHWMIGTGDYFDEINIQIENYTFNIVLYSIICLSFSFTLISMLFLNIVDNIFIWFGVIKDIINKAKN